MTNVPQVSQYFSIDDSTVEAIIAKINTEEGSVRRGYNSSISFPSPPIDYGVSVDASELNLIVSKINEMKNKHCYCEGEIAWHYGCTTNNFVQRSSNFSEGASVNAQKYNDVINDINELGNATLDLDCIDNVPCSCTTNDSFCGCNMNAFICMCESEGCDCDPFGTKCTCESYLCGECSCVNTCSCTNNTIYCSCNGVCGCNQVRAY